LAEPYLIGFDFDEEDLGLNRVRAFVSASAGSSAKKSKKKKTEED